jgi:predicted amidophosphoribosyltransferase
VLPAPLHPRRQAERGYNQPALSEDVLRRERHTPPQVGLDGDKRRANVAGAFACPPAHPALACRTLLLVDDVCTTGATLASCARTLLAAGAREVWGLTLARPSL